MLSDINKGSIFFIYGLPDGLKINGPLLFLSDDSFDSICFITFFF